MSKFGRQPARMALRRERYTIKLAAEIIGVPESHLRIAVGGYARPMDAVREKLPVLVGVPLEDLFTPDALAKPYDASKNAWVGIA
jgi:hypothetical protein